MTAISCETPNRRSQPKTENSKNTFFLNGPFVNRLMFNQFTQGHQSFPCSFNGSAQPFLRNMRICLLPSSSESFFCHQTRRSKLRLSVRATLDDAVDPPIQPPQYYSYDDISGEPGPAFSTSRNNIPDEPFWSADVPRIMRRTRADVPKKTSSPSSSSSSSKASQRKPGSRRRRNMAEEEAPEEAQSQKSKNLVVIFLFT